MVLPLDSKAAACMALALAWRDDRLRRRTIPNPAITITTALAGSGTLDLGKDNPFAVAKASNAATSPAEASVPLTPWLKFNATSERSVPVANSQAVIDPRETCRPYCWYPAGSPSIQRSGLSQRWPRKAPRRKPSVFRSLYQ